ncbi:hypothetical protein D3C80_1326910 [compost metagenome]
MVVRHVGDQQTGQRGDRHIDQETDRHMVGLEIDPDHRPQFEVDEQQQDVVDRGVALIDHAAERHHRRPGGSPADGEQRQVVKALDQQVAERFGQPMQVLTQRLGPIQFQDAAPRRGENIERRRESAAIASVFSQALGNRLAAMIEPANDDWIMPDEAQAQGRQARRATISHAPSQPGAPSEIGRHRTPRRRPGSGYSLIGPHWAVGMSWRNCSALICTKPS